jgi:hypothetical protein
MSVDLTISETLDGTAIADNLEGSGSPTGLDLGAVVSEEYAPITNKTNNTGRQDLFIRHNAVTDPITNVVFFLQQYGAGTGNSYGGQRTASGDLTDIFALGAASGDSKNNADGLSGGIWIDQDWDVATANQFDKSTRPTYVNIFGDNGTDGIDLASGFGLLTDAMVYDNTGETAASAPIAGQIGKAGDSALGDNAHIRMRVYLPASFTKGGYFQVEFATAYRYTA